MSTEPENRRDVTRQGQEALGKLAQDLLDNPLISGALSRAFEAREKAVQAQEVAMGALNIPSAADAQLPPENSKIKVPHLYVGTDQDAVCRPEMLDVSRPLLTDLTEVPIVHAAHWSPYEAPKEMATPIREWLLKKFLDKQ